MAGYYGHEYEVAVYAYFKVAIAKTDNKDEIDEAAFDATCRLYEHDTDIEVLDNNLIGIEQNQKHFTVANVGLELKVKLTAYTTDEAYSKAESMARDVELPAGVAFFECEAIDAERGENAIDWDLAVGE